MFKTAAELGREFRSEVAPMLKSKGFDFLDAPISGGQAGAEGGTLTVMVGGDEKPFTKAEQIINYCACSNNYWNYSVAWYGSSYIAYADSNSLSS